MLKTAVVGGAGAVGMDVIMGQLNNYLPASLKSDPNTVGIGDAVKAGITVVVGKVLSKYTRGLSMKMAAGALTVQMADILRTFVPGTVALGYYSPARITHGNPRIGPNTALLTSGVHRYQPAGTSPLLSRYLPQGVSPLLSRSSAGTHLRFR